MNNTLHSVLIVAVIAGVSALLRFAPSLLFPAGRETPGAVKYLGDVLPYAIMGMLVVYCLKDVSLLSGSHGAPEAICIVLVAVLHLWKKNVLLSILSGTLCYMLLVQLVFV